PIGGRCDRCPFRRLPPPSYLMPIAALAACDRHPRRLGGGAGDQPGARSYPAAMRSPPVRAHVQGIDPLAEAAAVEADVIQMFLSNPQGWEKPPERQDADELRDSEIGIYVHAPYLINVCSPKPNVRYGSRKILTQTCEAAADVGALAVVVHPGHAEDGLEAGVGGWSRTLEMLESDVPVYLENTAGGDHAVARRFDALARLWEQVAGADTDVEI